MKRTFAILGVLLALAAPALAVQPGEMLPDPAQEARARELSQKLRCLVCQNQSIDDSNAELARDLRILVRQRIGAGDSDAQVIDYLKQRYGDYVLMAPPVRGDTLALWFGPALVLVGAALWMILRARRNARLAAAAPLSDAERAELDRLMHTANDRPKDKTGHRTGDSP